jgi:type II secretory pathway component PulF
MARFPWLFDRMQVRMVEAGEEGGFLPDVFRRLADYLERDHQVRQSIKQKTLYPKLVLGLLLFVLPVRVPLTLGTYLAELTRLLLWVGGVGLFLWVVCRFLFSTSAGRDLYDRIKLALPVIGGLVRKMTVARFARTLAALYSSGVPVASALQMAGESCGNHALERLTANIVPAVSKGNSIALSMEATRFFPTMFTGMVSTGETTGNLDQMLEKAADFYEEEAIHATTQLVVILGVAALLFAAIMVLMKLLSFYAGMIGGIMPSEG